MPLQANLVIANHVPANHTFTPSGSRMDRGVVTSLWEDADHLSSSLGMWTVTERFTKGTGRSTVDTCQFSMALPVTATVDSVNQLLYTPRFEGKFFMPKAASPTHLLELVTMAGSLLALAAVKDVVQNRRASW